MNTTNKILEKNFKNKKQTSRKKNFFNWHDIEWQKVCIVVKKLQKELVVAYNNKDLVKVYKLQNKLMMSFEARALSVRRVANNKGKNTAGFDKIIWNNPLDKYEAIKELRIILLKKSGHYQPGPVQRIWIPKKYSKELRPLGIPNMIGRALQALIFPCLDPVVEEQSDTSSYGFRKFRSPNNATTRIRTLLDKKTGPRWVCMLVLANALIRFHISFQKID